jgi:hypothetical protein
MLTAFAIFLLHSLQEANMPRKSERRNQLVYTNFETLLKYSPHRCITNRRIEADVTNTVLIVETKATLERAIYTPPIVSVPLHKFPVSAVSCSRVTSFPKTTPSYVQENRRPLYRLRVLTRTPEHRCSPQATQRIPSFTITTIFFLCR